MLLLPAPDVPQNAYAFPGSMWREMELRAAMPGREG